MNVGHVGNSELYQATYDTMETGLNIISPINMDRFLELDSFSVIVGMPEDPIFISMFPVPNSRPGNTIPQMLQSQNITVPVIPHGTGDDRNCYQYDQAPVVEPTQDGSDIDFEMETIETRSVDGNRSCKDNLEVFTAWVTEKVTEGLLDNPGALSDNTEADAIYPISDLKNGGWWNAVPTNRYKITFSKYGKPFHGVHKDIFFTFSKRLLDEVRCPDFTYSINEAKKEHIRKRLKKAYDSRSYVKVMLSHIECLIAVMNAVETKILPGLKSDPLKKITLKKYHINDEDVNLSCSSIKHYFRQARKFAILALFFHCKFPFMPQEEQIHKALELYEHVHGNSSINNHVADLLTGLARTAQLALTYFPALLSVDESKELRTLPNMGTCDELSRSQESSPGVLFHAWFSNLIEQGFSEPRDPNWIWSHNYAILPSARDYLLTYFVESKNIFKSIIFDCLIVQQELNMSPSYSDRLDIENQLYAVMQACPLFNAETEAMMSKIENFFLALHAIQHVVLPGLNENQKVTVVSEDDVVGFFSVTREEIEKHFRIAEGILLRMLYGRHLDSKIRIWKAIILYLNSMPSYHHGHENTTVENVLTSLNRVAELALAYDENLF